jgi:hypothetical protein
LAIGRVADVTAAGAARALREPVCRIRGPGEGGIGMCDAALMAEVCKSERLFRACDCGGVVAK